MFSPTCGNIGEEPSEYEFEPLPTAEPIHEPSPAVEPVREPEKVPA